MERRAQQAGALSLALLLSATAAHAGPADKVYLPAVEAGEREFEFRGGYQNGGEEDDLQQYVADFGYGVNARWFTEIAGEYEKLPGEGGEFEALEWENIFLLTEPGEHWLDVGLFAEYEYSLEGGPDEIVIGPLLQKDFGRLQANFNPLVEREIGDGAEDEFEFLYALQLKWRINPMFEPGLQAFGEEDSHRIGPAMFGRMHSHGREFKYDAAILFGTGSAAADLTVRFQFEYEM
jgi:hypothetical protein